MTDRTGEVKSTQIRSLVNVAAVEDINRAKKALAVAQDKALRKLRSEYTAMVDSTARFEETVRVARDAGIPWRVIGEAIERSPEWVRTIYQRGRK